MDDQALLGPWVRRFLLEHLVAERNLARNTQIGYRDALKLLILFIQQHRKKPIHQLTVADVSADLVRRFLADLEVSRRCRVASRNQRLAAIRALAGFIGAHSPAHLEWSGEMCSIPFKKAERTIIPYLEKPEIDALLAAPDKRTLQGRRDYALLLFLYNTGARASEAAQLTIADVDLHGAYVKITGKGAKQRLCPLWRATIIELKALVGQRQPNEPVFINRSGQPITRFGIHTLVERHALVAQCKVPSLGKKRVSPHSIRHTSATHLLRAGVDINTIRGWLGHVSLDTTNIYAEVDLDAKARALAKCAVVDQNKPVKRWRDQPALLEFLRGL